MRSSGLAKRARLVMSHATGKVEIVGMTETHVFFKYVRAHEDEDSSRFLVFERDPEAYWFDDYEEAVQVYEMDTALLTGTDLTETQRALPGLFRGRS